MEFRAVTQQESLELMELQAQAFFFTYDRKKYKEEIDANGTWRTGRGAFDENGKLAACLSLLSFEAQFDGSTVGLGGIGGVASRPEVRNSGNVRGLMASVLNEMADNGDVFSFLYPFSNEYYRKFGYESCHRAAHITAPLEPFRALRQPGHAEHFLPGPDGTDPTPMHADYTEL
jgi:predicted acetyltransferase